MKQEIYRLYYEDKLTQREIANRYGVGEATLSRFFYQQGWTSRFERRGIPKRKFENDEQRKEASKERRRKTQRRLRELRMSIFGTKCDICDIETKGERRKLAIHRIDGSEHHREALWRKEYLSSLKKEEWAPLCIPCHRGIHWLMDWVNKDYEFIKFQSKQTSQSSRESLRPLTRKDYCKPNTCSSKRESAKEVRKSLFGESCYFCGEIEKGKKMVIHRKDGRPHESRILASAKYLRNLDPDEWVPLCNKCHRHVTWARDILGMKWDDLTLNIQK
ncbi:MAG: hypothetical protein ACXACG_10240 [Candidatus Thorarchaeota archaeon]